MPTRQGLLATTALHGCVGLLLFVSSPALAQFAVTGGSTVTGSQTLSGSQTGTVAVGGTLQTTGAAVTQSGTASNVVLDNAGTIRSTGGRGFDTSGGNTVRTLTLTNRAGALIQSDANDAVRINTNIISGGVTIDNAGAIRAAAPTDPASAVQGQALDLRTMNTAGVPLTVVNRATGVIEALNDDALRPGLNAAIDNAGVIRSYGANTSGGANGTADAIDAGGRTGVTVTNRSGGLISGARHGITADTDITVVNEAGGTIVGRNGSGVGSDGNGTVINRGLISGDYAGVGSIFNSSGVASTNGDGDGVDIDYIGTIVNEGTIRGTGAGGVDSGGRPNGADGIAMGGGTITNSASGVISGTGHGIMVDDGAEGAAYGATTITNAGRIESRDGPAITLIGPYANTITNSGTIAGGGGDPVAIAFGAGNDRLVIRGGAITGKVLGGGGTDALEVQLGSGGRYVIGARDVYRGFATATVGSGTLVVDGPLALGSALTVASGATLSGTGTITVPAATVAGTVMPGDGASGTLAVAGNLAFAAGSRLQVGIDPAGNATKLAVGGAATLSNGATVQVTAADGLYLTGRSYEILTASGGVTGQFGAVERLNPAPLGGGTLALSQTGTAVLLQLNPGNPFNGLRNSVNIANMDVGFAIAGAGSTDSLTLEGTSTVRADVTNLAQFQIGTSTGTATGVTLASGTQSVAATTVKANAQLAVNTRLASPTVTVERGGLLSGGGRIIGALSNAGTLSPGTSPGVLTVEGAVTNATGSTLRVEIDGPTAGTGAGFHDQVVVSGTPGTFAAGGTLAPVIRGISGDATNAFTPRLGQGFTIVTASGGVTGAFAGIAQPASGLPAGTRFDTVYGTNAITLAATPVRYGRLAAAGVSATANQSAVGAALDAVRPAAGTRPSDAAKPLFDALYPLSGQAIPAALDSLGGAVHAEAVTAARDSARLFGDAVQGRMAALRADGLAKSIAPLAPLEAERGTALGLWARALGRFANSDGDGNAAGYRQRGGGIALGADRDLSDDLTAGAAFGYQRTAVDVRGSGDRTDIDGYSAALYGTYRVGAWFVDAQAMYGFGQYDSRRVLQFGSPNAVNRSAQGDSDGHGFGAAVGTGYAVTWNGARIEPFAGLRFDRVTRDGFTETGAGALGLSVDDTDLSTLRTSLGLRTSWRLKAGEVALEPELRARWDHDFLDVAARSGARLLGASYTVSGTQPGRDAAVLGAGLTADLGNRFQAYGSYDADLRRDATGHALSAGLSYRW
ncbi:autotransporter domain-containing protein (plasmid) [Azospirillum brasilense]|uniref:Autotransporter domain-containing protein n=1 Tax=Azospirillum brasilense TaxID=192 RepID=A0A4D8R1T6_AZOBR|nr:autotransporter domain-containing protein [Azospirillum brasilense]QCO16617.1 autotransporter domain-containing protein [Azospirillum brasilense]